MPETNPFRTPAHSGLDVDVDGVGPPPGPPPPKVPEGWLARWDDNYKQFFYVNLATKKPQWEMPTESAKDAPPPYQSTSPEPSHERQGSSQSYHQGGPAGVQSDSSPPVNPQVPQPGSEARSRSRASLGSKISNFIKSHSSQPGSRPTQRPAYSTPPPSRYHGGIPPQPQYYPQQQPVGMGTPYSAGAPPRRGFGGLGTAGGAALGLGGGLLGGLLIGDLIEDQYQDGMDGGGGDFGDGGFGF